MRYSSMSTCFYSGHAPTINTQVTRLLAFRVRFSALRLLKTCDVCFPSRLIIKIMASYSLLIPCLIPCSFQPVPGVVFGTGLVELTSRKQKKRWKRWEQKHIVFLFPEPPVHELFIGLGNKQRSLRLRRCFSLSLSLYLFVCFSLRARVYVYIHCIDGSDMKPKHQSLTV